jgi:hypothetical protein
MTDERISQIIRGNKLSDLIYTAIFQTVRQVPDGWGILTAEEKARIESVGRAQADDVQKEIGYRLEQMFRTFIASDRKYFIAAEKGVAIKDGAVTLTLTAGRTDVPDELYTHRGDFMVIITDGEATLQELNGQGDLFSEGAKSPAGDLADGLRETPIVAQYLASAAKHRAEEAESETPADPFDLWVDEFLIGAGQIMGSEIAALYDEGGEAAPLLARYFGAGWGPAEAAANETIAEGDRRAIDDGPHPINERDAAELAPDGFDAWHDAFLLALAAAGFGETIDKYGDGEPLAPLLLDYFNHGWEPVAAMLNECTEESERRLISDGPDQEADAA